MTGVSLRQVSTYLTKKMLQMSICLSSRVNFRYYSVVTRESSLESSVKTDVLQIVGQNLKMFSKDSKLSISQFA